MARTYSQSRLVFSVSLCIVLLHLLSLLTNTGFGQRVCVTNILGEGDCENKHNDWCVCDANYGCYLSRELYLREDDQTVQKYDEYGCLNIFTVCPYDIVGSYPKVFNCCNNSDFCNENLTVIIDNSTSASPFSTSNPTLASPFSTSTPSPSIESDTTFPWLLIVGISTLCLAILIAISIIVGLSLYYSSCCSLSLLFKCRQKVCFLCSRHRNRTLPRETDFNSIPVEINPVPINMNDITITSGSGKGMPHLVQRTIARSFILGNAIGGGRFGQVYIGYYQGEQYAVKKFFSRDEHSWYHESEIYNTINMRHDNILSCFATDILSNNGVTELWLITQYQPRGSLYDVLSNESLEMETVMRFAVSICRGLTFLHDELSGTQGKPAIAHRDIKSKNILVKENYACCIADFGMALVKNSSSPNLATPQNIRQGTKRYMAPEVLAETINLTTFESFLRTDMYAYGLVLWEVCRRCDHPGGPEEYELPFMSVVPLDPSFEDMREIVVDKGCSPQIPNRWASSELLKSLTMLMKECWYSEAAARPTAFYVKKKLERITQNSQLKFSRE